MTAIGALLERQLQFPSQDDTTNGNQRSLERETLVETILRTRLWTTLRKFSVGREVAAVSA